MKGQSPTFQTDLQSRLIAATLSELRSGWIESFGFERLIQTVLNGLGAKEVRVVSRPLDKGADILAAFRISDVLPQVIAVQAKHWQASPRVGEEVVQQLIQGIEAESAQLGMVITSGTITRQRVAPQIHILSKRV